LDFLNRATALEATILTVTLWHIWDARNQVREGESLMHPRSVAEKALAYIQMIATYLYKSNPDHRREAAPTPKWSPPPEGMVMINVDAAIFSPTRQMGLGVVIRDHSGQCLAACSETQDEVVTPEMAEALALRRAVLFAREEGFSRVIFSSDCLSLVNRVNALQQDRSIIGPVIQDIRNAAASFLSCYFRHVGRGLNYAANYLAKSSFSSVCSVWRGVVPDCIRETLCNDLMSL
jgi:ribonuclease HI